MQITIKTTDFNLTPDINDYAQKKVLDVEKFLGEATTNTIADVELARTTRHHRQGPVFYAEVNLESDGTLYRATAEGETMFEAIDEMRDEIMREVRKDKEKQQTMVRRGAARVKEWLRWRQ